ncbi:MAG: glycosyltransferase [Candidatus Kerfeldbacteria bacterium]
MQISVVIPSYNEEKYIERTLQSLARQTYRDFEVVLAITGDDNTKAVAQQLLDREGLAYQFIFPGEKGVTRARQEGSDAATHEIIASTDADAIVPPDWLEQINDFFIARPDAAAVYGPVYFFDGGWAARVSSRIVYPAFLRVSRLFGNDNAAGNNLAFRSEAFRRSGGYDRSLHSCEDIDLVCKMKEQGSVAYCPDIFVEVSARRLQSGSLKLLCYTIKNYVRFFILHKPPLSFDDIR